MRLVSVSDTRAEKKLKAASTQLERRRRREAHAGAT